MQRLRYTRLFISLLLLCCFSSSCGVSKPEIPASSIGAPIAERPAIDITRRSLAEVTLDDNPWEPLEPNSEQNGPYYLGATPRDIVLGQAHIQTPEIPRRLQTLAAEQARQLQQVLQLDPVEFECWPMRNEEGQLTWAFARYRQQAKDAWSWLDQQQFANLWSDQALYPYVPKTYSLTAEEDFAAVFNDSLSFASLYDKPFFGGGLFTTLDGGLLYAAWLPTGDLEQQRRQMLSASGKTDIVFRWLPQPARFYQTPRAFTLRLTQGQAAFQETIAWADPVSPPAENAAPLPATSLIPDWPADLPASFQEDVAIFSGEKEALFPISGKRMLFTRRNSADAQNQLLELTAYLEERYQQLGIRTQRQEFMWNHIPQANLIAILPGTTGEKGLPPVVLADHLDAAFAEDVFDASGERVSAPGADDNAVGIALLLRAAELFKNLPHQADIWLVHLTGEEFPADDLGARYFLAEMLRQKQDLGGVVVADMIGYNAGDNRIFQINAGQSAASLALAQLAVMAEEIVNTPYEAVLRPRYDDYSYLYNTDALFFSDMGYPVILVNERVNKLENMYRRGYHDMTDTTRLIDYDYALAIVKTTLETVLRAANKGRMNNF